MKVTYVGGRDGVEFMLDGALHTMNRDETIDLPEDQAERLLALGTFEKSAKKTATAAKGES